MALTSTVNNASSAAGSYVQAYQVPAGKLFANVSLNLTNPTGSVATIRVAVSNVASPNTVDHIEYDSQLQANGGSLRRTNIVMSASERLLIKSDVAGVGIRAFGLEQA